MSELSDSHLLEGNVNLLCISGWQCGQVDQKGEHFDLTYCSSKYSRAEGWPTVLRIGPPVGGW